MHLINDLKAHNELIRADISLAMSRVLDSGWFALGPEVQAFEEEFADYCGTNHCVSVGNGTDALEISLRGMGVSSGDEVILAANAGMYATIAVLNIGAIPVFADISESGYLLSPDSVQARISTKTKAIIVTHLFGLLADMEKFQAIAQDRNIRLVEDCAQAHGALRQGKMAGSWGDAAAFSFYPTKNLGALGDGGAILTKHADFAEAFRELRQYGWTRKYVVTREGGKNSRLDELQAAILRVKLTFLGAWNQKRREIASIYSENLQHQMIKKPRGGSDEDNVSHLYVIETTHRDSLRNHLNHCNIASDIHYPILDIDQAVFDKNSERIELPNSQQSVKRVLTLPCYPELDTATLCAGIQLINRWEL